MKWQKITILKKFLHQIQHDQQPFNNEHTRLWMDKRTLLQLYHIRQTIKVKIMNRTKQ